MPLVPSPSTGYTDYQTFGNYDSSVLWNTASASGTAPQVSPVMNMTKYECVAGYFLCNAGVCQVTFAWYSDSLLTLLIGQRTFTLTAQIAAAEGVSIIPNEGAFLQITFSNIAGGAYQMGALAFGTNRQPPIQTLPQNSVLIDQQGTPLGANATLTFYPSDYYAGPATIFASCGQVFNMTMQYLTTGGLLHATWQVNNQAANVAFDYFVNTPTGTWALAFANTTAVATVLFLALTPTITGAT